jgi:Leucine-rich repeat (LRR) protein
VCPAQIELIQGLDHLKALRVLNLAGNTITRLERVHGLASLTELNLRRNKLSEVAAVPPLGGECDSQS